MFLEGLRGGGMSVPTVLNKVDLTVDVSEPPIVNQFMVRPKEQWRMVIPFSNKTNEHNIALIDFCMVRRFENDQGYFDNIALK